MNFSPKIQSRLEMEIFFVIKKSACRVGKRTYYFFIPRSGGENETRRSTSRKIIRVRRSGRSRVIAEIKHRP